MRTVLLLLLMTWSAICLAQPTGTSLKKLGNAGSKTWAVVVGISDYQDKDIPDLRFAHKDAEAFALWLQSPAGGSLDGDQLQVLINDKATAGRVAEALDALLERVQENDKVFIYFSGHGDVERKTLSQPGFLLCWDAPSRVYMGGGTYSLAYLQEVVATLSVQNKAKVTVIADACRAGKLAGSQIGGPQLTSLNLQRQQANELKILSCQSQEYSLEGTQWGGGRGVFSYHLMDGLYGLADRNVDGVVTLGELDRYLEDHVTSQAAPISQVPVLLGNKTDGIAIIHAETLADLNRIKSGEMVFLAATDSRGLEDEVLADLDSGIVKQFLAFKEAVTEKRFFPDPENDRLSADELYTNLIAEPGLSPLHGAMTRNYAATLQDDAQQTLNGWLKSSQDVTLAAGGGNSRWPRKVFTEKVKTYPRCLDRAAELLGNKHYMYAALKARKYFFEGYLLANSNRNPNRELGEQALSLFRQSFEWQAELPQAYWQMSWVYGWNLLQPDSAEVYAQKAMELNPSWLLPYTDLAYMFSEKYKQFDRAIPWLEQAMQLDSNSVHVWHNWGIYFSNKKEYSKAEQQFKKAIQIDSTDASVYTCLGNVYDRARRYAEAEQQYKKAIQLDSTGAIVYGNLGLHYGKARRNAEAEQQLKKAIQIDSTLTLAYHTLGNIYGYTRRYAEAEQQFKKVMQLDSTITSAYQALGDVYRNTGHYAEAEQQYKKTIQLDSTFDIAYFRLGEVYRDTRRNTEAELQFKKVIHYNSSDAYSYLNLAYLQSLQNQTDAAFDYLEKALKSGWNDYNWMQQDSTLALLREQKERWETLMQNTIVPDTKDDKAWNTLGQVYIRARNYAPAEAAMQKAVALDASSAPYMSNLGFIYLNLGRYAEAEAALKKAIVLDSAFANARKHLGMVCFKSNRPDEARQNFLKAITLNPNYMPSYLGMAYLLAAEGKTAEAIDCVEQAIGKGATMEQLESDVDLAPLRALPEWAVLMNKHFPDQFDK